MPILHTQLAGQGTTPDGKQFQLPAALGETFAAALVQHGKSVPQGLSGLALIDTGASNTCIDDEAAQSISLPVIDVEQCILRLTPGLPATATLSKLKLSDSVCNSHLRARWEPRSKSKDC